MADIIYAKQRLTRKDHVCFGCGRSFPPKTKMLYETVVDDIIFNTYLCKTCQSVSYEFDGEEFCFGGLYEYAVELEKEQQNGDNKERV